MEQHAQHLHEQHPLMRARNGLTPAEEQDVPRPVVADSLAARVWQQVDSPPHADELLEPDVSPIREATPTPSDVSMLSLDQSVDELAMDPEEEADVDSVAVEVVGDECWRMWILEASTVAVPRAREELRIEVDRLAGEALISEEDMLSRAADIHVFTFFDRRFVLKALAEVDPEALASIPAMHAYIQTWPRWKIESERNQAAMRLQKASARVGVAESPMLLWLSE